jgi:hypothetical protein
VSQQIAGHISLAYAVPCIHRIGQQADGGRTLQSAASRGGQSQKQRLPMLSLNDRFSARKLTYPQPQLCQKRSLAVSALRALRAWLCSETCLPANVNNSAEAAIQRLLAGRPHRPVLRPFGGFRRKPVVVSWSGGVSKTAAQAPAPEPIVTQMVSSHSSSSAAFCAERQVRKHQRAFGL